MNDPDKLSTTPEDPYEVFDSAEFSYGGTVEHQIMGRMESAEMVYVLNLGGFNVSGPITVGHDRLWYTGPGHKDMAIRMRDAMNGQLLDIANAKGERPRDSVLILSSEDETSTALVTVGELAPGGPGADEEARDARLKEIYEIGGSVAARVMERHKQSAPKS